MFILKIQRTRLRFTVYRLSYSERLYYAEILLCILYGPTVSRALIVRLDVRLLRWWRERNPPAILFAAAWPCHVNEYMISSGPDYTAYSASSAADSCCGGSIELPVMLIALATNTRVGCQIKSIPPSIHPGLRAS